MRRAPHSLLAVLLAGGGMIVLSSPVRAECPYFVIPPATEAARTARELVVGTVVENVDGNYSDFRLNIDHVLRGSAKVGDVRRFDMLWPGWPPSGTFTDSGQPFMPCEPIPAWKGNVIALALDALAPDGETRYNAASWLSGRLPFNRDVPRTTLEELRWLATLPATDAASSPFSDVKVGAWDLVMALALGMAGVLGGLSWQRRKRDP